MKRNFNDWLSAMRDTIATWRYYTDFEKVYSNVKTIKVELNILNSLINSKNIEKDYKRCLRDETLESLIAIIKTSYFRNQSSLAHNKKMTDKDKYYYELAEKFLYKPDLLILSSKALVHGRKPYLNNFHTGT